MHRTTAGKYQLGANLHSLLYCGCNLFDLGQHIYLDKATKHTSELKCADRVSCPRSKFYGSFQGWNNDALSRDAISLAGPTARANLTAQRPFLDIEEGPLLFAATFPGASCIPKVKLPEARRGGGAEVVLELVGEGADHRALALAAISVQVDPPSRR